MKEIKEGFFGAFRMFWFLVTFQWMRFVCEAWGHKRGKLIRKSNSVTHGRVIKDYECPRCRAQWAREVKA